MQVLTMAEVNAVSGGGGILDVLNGIGLTRGGVTAAGGGLLVESALADGLIIGGGVVVAVAGVGLIGHGLYELVHQ